MNKSIFRQKTESPFFVIFTDLDGTLLDHDTYQWESASPALELCRARGFPVVLVSSKTRAEMEPLRKRMGIRDPFISENGGAVFFSNAGVAPLSESAGLVAGPDKNLQQLSLGVPYSVLVKALREIRAETGLAIRGFSQMNIDEICALTGLGPKDAGLAAMREFDEPFVISGERSFDMEEVVKAATGKGLNVSRGGRFYHLQGGNDKGKAMDLLLSWYRQSHEGVSSIALGDSPNDFPMLERADFPILVRSPDDIAMLKTKIPRLILTRETGPKGWNSAILDILRNIAK